jgi:hypothetical protein
MILLMLVEEKRDRKSIIEVERVRVVLVMVKEW